jgi:sugar O-acyltransferase (sialic acid O-acetyltransferase NeuD family)
MTRRILILGAGGHAQVIADILFCKSDASDPLVPIGYLDDDVTIHGCTRIGLPVLGSLTDLASIEHDGAIIGIGNNHIRRDLFKNLSAIGITFASAIHPTAIISKHVEMGVGLVIGPGAIVNTGSVIGDNVILNTASSVDHHNTVQNHAHIAPGVHTGGNVVIGEGTLVGIGASILPQRQIGAWSVVGAGAVVTQDLPANSVAIGIPARVQPNKSS